MMLKIEKNVILFLAFIILGVTAGVQVKSTLQASKQTSTIEKRIEYYTKQLDEEKRIGQELRQQLKEGTDFAEQLMQNSLERSNDETLLMEWDSVRLKLGLTDVAGPGVIITLDDAPARADVPPRDLIIHDQDIKIIVNELKKAGAQAISINGERLTAVSEMVCGGPTILINRNRYPVPYIIHAIGDPELMSDIILLNDRVEVMRSNNIRIEIEKKNEVIVPRFAPGYAGIDDLHKLVSGMEVVNNEIQ